MPIRVPNSPPILRLASEHFRPLAEEEPFALPVLGLLECTMPSRPTHRRYSSQVLSGSEFSDQHYSTPTNNKGPPPLAPPLAAMDINVETPVRRNTQRHKKHRSSISTSSFGDAFFTQTPTSPTKRFRRIDTSPAGLHRHKASMSCSESSSGSSSLFEAAELSPGSCASPYIFTQPNLQDVFITLAHKERRVLEAKEELAIAERELQAFKYEWRNVLNTPSVNVSPSPMSPLLLEENVPPGNSIDTIVSGSSSSRGLRNRAKRVVSTGNGRRAVTGLGIYGGDYYEPHRLREGTEQERCDQVYKNALELDSDDEYEDSGFDEPGSTVGSLVTTLKWAIKNTFMRLWYGE
ncbi:hypothetical protein TRVA0_028S00188 [Trichomonascus vanleenenianus]|uniref:uncharacterized protein n=1 Tax=Trichomonascus vanleenenianus TaxID=2268995 RepID=UPI003EC9A481